MIKRHLIRIAILISFFTVGMLGIFAIPMDDSATWYSDLFLSKLLGGTCIWIFYRLYKVWKRTDSWIRAYDKWNDKQVKSQK